MNKPEKPLYYADYIQLDKIIGAQTPRSVALGQPAHDEHLFIVTHQSYELWFKQILHELDSVLAELNQPTLSDNATPLVVARLERISLIQRSLLTQIDILETMTPMDFLAFRDLLMPASGFQSHQFRLLECKFGLMHTESSAYLSRLNAADRAVVERAMQEKSLFQLVEAWLERLPFLQHRDYSFWQQYQAAVKDLFERDQQCLLDNPLISDQERTEQLARLQATYGKFQLILSGDQYETMIASGERRLSYLASCAALFILLYRDYPVFHLPYQLLSSLMTIDDNFSAWRYRHYHMAMRMIGSKVGTGGSAGAQYLQQSIPRRVFDDIANLNVFLVSRSALPPLPKEYERLLGFHTSSMNESMK